MDQNYYTHGEQEFLLKIARETLGRYLRSGEKFEPHTVNQKLWEKHGVFVSLHRHQELRGCIGIIEGAEPMIMSVRDNVLSAARDPRFDPVEYSEFDEIKIEISILTEPEKITFKDIKKGDGVIVSRDGKSATYLPQVWQDLAKSEEFLSTLCLKAGLESDCYKKDKTEFFRYQAIVFSEKR